MNSLLQRGSLLALLATLFVSTQTAAVEITLMADTMVLNNGGDDIGLGAGSDQEDNFGGRVEVIAGNNNNNPRDMLLRFDPTPIADDIADPTRVVSSGTILLIQRAGRDQPEGGNAFFEVYPLVSENSGWNEGTQQGSRAGFSAEGGSVSRAWKNSGINEEGEEAETWFSEQQLNIGGGINFNEEADSDTGDLIGGGVFSPTETFYELSFDADQLNALLPEWLADPEFNPGIVVTSPDAVGQWFFESKEGDGGPIFDIQFTTVDVEVTCDFNNDGNCDISDLDSLMYDGLANQGAQFDLDGSGAVDLVDRDQWLSDAGTRNNGAPYLPGDTDLNGTVDASDLNNLGVSWQADDATTWAQGDFNGDGIVNAGDLNSIGVNWLSGTDAAPAAVPEPAGWLPSLTLLLLLGARMRMN